MLPLLAGIGLGVKGLFDSAKEKQQKMAQAQGDASQIQFSPWSGINVNNLAGKDYSAQSPLSGLLAGGLAGATTGINIENALADKGLAKQKANYYASLLKPKNPLLAGEEDLEDMPGGVNLV